MFELLIKGIMPGVLFGIPVGEVGVKNHSITK